MFYRFLKVVLLVSLLLCIFSVIAIGEEVPSITVEFNKNTVFSDSNIDWSMADIADYSWDTDSYIMLNGSDQFVEFQVNIALPGIYKMELYGGSCSEEYVSVEVKEIEGSTGNYKIKTSDVANYPAFMLDGVEFVNAGVYTIRISDFNKIISADRNACSILQKLTLTYAPEYVIPKVIKMNNANNALSSYENKGSSGWGQNNEKTIDFFYLQDSSHYAEAQFDIKVAGTYELTVYASSAKAEIMGVGINEIENSFDYYLVDNENLRNPVELKCGQYELPVGKCTVRITNINVDTGNAACAVSKICMDYIAAEARADVSSLKVQGTTVIGLDDTKTYCAVPFTANGADFDNEVILDKGIDSVDITQVFDNAVGVYGVYVPGDKVTTYDSDFVIVYVEGTYENRKNIMLSESGEYNVYSVKGMIDYNKPYGFNFWSVGNITVPGASGGEVETAFTYKSPDPQTPMTVFSTNFFLSTTVKERNETHFTLIRYAYAYNPDEIIPVGEIKSMKFSIAQQNAKCKLTATAQAKVVLRVLNRNGKITKHTVFSDEYAFEGYSEETFARKICVNFQNAENLPQEGYVLGFEIFPLGKVNDYTPKSTRLSGLGIYFAFSVEDYEIFKPTLEYGMSLVLDGKIGVKVTALTEETVDGLTLANVTGTTNYVDFNNNEAVFYVNPKDVLYTTIAFDVVNGDDTQSFEITIPEYVRKLKAEATGKTLALVNALENYYTYVDKYFDSAVTEVEEIVLEEAEIDALNAITNPKISGVSSFIDFNSTSLILEEDIAIRHYFKLVGDAADISDEEFETMIDDGQVSISGANSFGIVEGIVNYFYIDIDNIASNELSNTKTVTITVNGKSYTVSFSVLNYVQLCLEYNDVKLKNLAKVLYRYSVAADAYTLVRN